MHQTLSPYDLSLSNSSPLRPLLTELIDFNRLRLQEEIQLTYAQATPAPRNGASSPIRLDFQAELAKADTHLPIIFISGHGDIPMTVRAMKAGAVEFLTKPFREQDLLDAVQLALQRDRDRRIRFKDFSRDRRSGRTSLQRFQDGCLVERVAPYADTAKNGIEKINPRCTGRIAFPEGGTHHAFAMLFSSRL
jgi:hypothetical protein